MASNEAVNVGYYSVPGAGKDALRESGEDSALLAQEETVGADISHCDPNNMAYDLLLLQQRLVAIERLHLEEICELRRELERLSRAFLLQTPPPSRPL